MWLSTSLGFIGFTFAACTFGYASYSDAMNDTDDAMIQMAGMVFNYLR